MKGARNSSRSYSRPAKDHSHTITTTSPRSKVSAWTAFGNSTMPVHESSPRHFCTSLIFTTTARKRERNARARERRALYAVSDRIDEYRFEVKLNTDRMMHYVIFNRAIITVASGLLKIETGSWLNLFVTSSSPWCSPSVFEPPISHPHHSQNATTTTTARHTQQP